MPKPIEKKVKNLHTYQETHVLKVKTICLMPTPSPKLLLKKISLLLFKTLNFFVKLFCLTPITEKQD